MNRCRRYQCSRLTMPFRDRFVGFVLYVDDLPLVRSPQDGLAR